MSKSSRRPGREEIKAERQKKKELKQRLEKNRHSQEPGTKKPHQQYRILVSVTHPLKKKNRHVKMRQRRK